MNPGCLTAMACACCAVCSVDSWGGEIIAPSFGPMAKTVGSGTETQDARVLVSSESVLRKAGAGTWQLPLSYLVQPWTAAFAVDEGALEFLNGADAGDYVAPTTLPASITDKALLWVDATDTDHIVGEGTAVSTWYDRREPATVTTPAYCRASAYTGYTTDLPETVTMADGHAAVYFGGLQSGRCLEWLLPSGSRFTGSSAATMAKQVFVVHSVSNTYGTIFGGMNSTSVYWRDTTRDKSGDPDKSAGNYYWVSDCVWPALQSGRTYLDGVRIDGATTPVKKRLQLLEATARYCASSATSSFFGGNSKNASGGDYICEALVFTNRLTEAERLQVEEYLMAKWLPDRTARALKVELSRDAALKVDGAFGADAGERLALSGGGTVVKTGEGTLVHKNYASTTVDGEIDLQEGSLNLKSAAPVKVRAGTRYTVSNPAAGTMVARTSADAGVLVKDGDDRLDVNGLPSDVNRLEVAAGMLNVRAKTTLPTPASTTTYEIPIPNSGFEDFAATIAEKKPEGDGVMSIDWSFINDWKLAENGGAQAMDFERWTGKSSTMDGHTRSTWNFSFHPPEGKCALILTPTTANSGCARSQTFELSEAGAYELTFWYSGRENTSYIDMGVRAELVPSSGTFLSFGTVYHTYIGGYLQTRLRIENVPAGTYYLRFRALSGPDVKVTSSGQMGRILIDDVHLYKVASDPLAASRWKIPGGDFEMALGHNLSKIYVDDDHTHPNWTFVQPPSWQEGDTYAHVGLTTMGTYQDVSAHGYGAFFNNSREPNAGSVELCIMRNGGKAVTTFTPPAGTWRLVGDYARLGSYGCFPKLKVEVEIGGETVELDRIAPESRLMRKMAAKKSFTVDGVTPVTLTLTAVNYTDNSGAYTSGIVADDLALESATADNLFLAGDCTSISGALKAFTSKSVGGISGVGQVRIRHPSEATSAFGTDTPDGNNMITIENLAGVYEDVEFPFAGRYRLSFYAHSRMSGKDGVYGANPLRVWIVANGKTNEIGRANLMNSDWVQRVFDFSITEPGNYRLGIQGTMDPTDAKTVKEAHVDVISLRQVLGTVDRAQPFAENCKIRVAEGAKLKVDFSGTNHVNSIRLGGHSVRGVIDAADYPEFLEGTGVFETDPAPGALLLLR